MNESKDYVEVSIRLPKSVFDFYKAFAQFRKETFETLLADIISDEVQHIIDDTAWWVEGLVELYAIEDYAPNYMQKVESHE